ncbi:MAG: antitoxin [Clostridiales bacterium]|jgi:toxin-antitoxin system protein|nr:antitoxin [Clostridiales bacterium]
MAFSIRLTDEERNVAETYAKINSISLGEAFKKALFEKIEDEYDFNLGEEAYNKYVKSGKKATPIKDFWRELDNE